MVNLARRSPRIFVFTISAAAIVLGGFIYILFRPEELLFLHWSRSVGLNALLSLIKPEQALTTGALSTIIIYSLPSLLWAFAYTLIITRLWIDKPHWIKYIWLSSIPVLILGFEILQYPGLLPGTFCLNDLLASILGIAMGIFISLPLKEQNHEN